MRLGFFPKLAWTGIKKNRRMYLPYILTCIGMVMMHFIVCSLVNCKPLQEMSGGTSLTMILSLGEWVIAVFSLLFLFYTNSFLIRRRTKEFGLYNILGMDKGNICRIIVFESAIVSAIGLAVGLVLGIAFSKLAELCLLNVLQGKADSAFTVSFSSLKTTLYTYLVIFFLLFLNSLRLVGRSKPLEMLSSEAVGEKPPKANWVLAVLGLVLLGFAYYMAVSIQSPLDAILWFFVAVIMVIIATYLMFISGSVTICKLLQKNKKYYYKAKHFVSVSSMAYRMKRNGAGLASVCILSTMVLVTLSSTCSLYIGVEDSLRVRYPRDICFSASVESLDDLGKVNTDRVRELAAEATEKRGVAMDEVQDYTTATATGLLDGRNLIIDTYNIDQSEVSTGDILMLTILPLDDYNAMSGNDLELDSGEVYLNGYRMDYNYQTISIENGREYTVKAVLSDAPINGNAASLIVPGLIVVTNNFADMVEPLMSYQNEYGFETVSLSWNYGFDTACDYDVHTAIVDDLSRGMSIMCASDDFEISHYFIESAFANRTDFYNTYGGLFFVGVLLSIVFICAAVLIIYYKQISEGYEDQSRFEIMQKVGMTDRDIRKSINSQVLIVFFTPLLFAGLHLAFAFPLVWKIMMLFNMVNITLLIFVTIGAFLLFAAFYAIVYKVTSNAYFAIVSGGRPRE